MRKMKDSGIEWIGEIPSEWEVRKINNCFNMIGSGTTPKSEIEDYYNGDIHWLQSGDIHGMYITNTEKYVNQNALQEFSALKIYKAPFIVMAMYGASIANTGIVKIDCCTNQACCVLSIPQNDICENYIYYSLISAKSELLLLSRGGTQPNISKDIIKQLRIPVPLLNNQQRIADFLDDKVSQIDSVISKTKSSIEEYKKLKQSIITETVTGKVKIENGKVCGKYDTYKDSGIEWIGEIPSEWSVCQIKRFAKLYNGKEIENEVIKSDYAIDVYGSGGVFKYTTNYLYDGEAVLFGRKGSIGKPLIVDGKFWTVDTMYFSTCKQELAMNKFLFYLLKIFPWDVYTTKTALPSIVGSEIFNSFVPVPSLTSQLSLITFLDKKCSEIDKLITKKEQLVVELEAYKKSLIYEVVTGKRSV